MDIKRINETLTEIDGAFRVESGPVRKKAVATKELLSDEVTASHYFAGTRKEVTKDPATGQTREVTKTGVDALGKPIKLGEEMEYIDWKNRHSQRAFYVYAKNDEGRFLLVGTHETEDAAMSQAVTLASGRATTAKGE